MPRMKFLQDKDYYIGLKYHKVSKGDTVDLPSNLSKPFIDQKICEPCDKKENSPKGPTLTTGAKKLLKKYPDLDLSKIGQDRINQDELEVYIKENNIKSKK